MITMARGNDERHNPNRRVGRNSRWYPIAEIDERQRWQGASNAAEEGPTHAGTTFGRAVYQPNSGTYQFEFQHRIKEGNEYGAAPSAYENKKGVEWWNSLNAADDAMSAYYSRQGKIDSAAESMDPVDFKLWKMAGGPNGPDDEVTEKPVYDYPEDNTNWEQWKSFGGGQREDIASNVVYKKNVVGDEVDTATSGTRHRVLKNFDSAHMALRHGRELLNPRRSKKYGLQGSDLSRSYPDELQGKLRN